MPRISRESLTRKTVDAAKPTGRLYRLRDATVPGLVLRVMPTGAKSWAILWGRGQERIIADYPVTTLEGARDAARRLLAEVADHGAPLAVIESRRPASARPATLREFVDGAYRQWVRHELKRGDEAADRILTVFAGIADTPLLEIDRKAVEVVITERRRATVRKTTGASAATTNRDLAAIKAALTKAVEWGALPAHPLDRLRASKVTSGGVVRYLTSDERCRLRQALQAREEARRAERASGNAWLSSRGRGTRVVWPTDGYTDHLMPMVLVAMNTGLRRGELFGLTWHDVNLAAQRLTVTAKSAKSGKVRHIPLNHEAHAVLARWQAQGAASGLVFPNSAGGRFDNIQTSWERLTEAAKLEAFRFHDLRHDFASQLVMAGVDLNTVRELLGHADIKMTLRYAHLAPDKLAEAVSRL
ncbi:integrase [Xanthomonas arboricola]|uniref:site-specific integrase n=1 Tax=Xanthomonas TaxID=338 RepID=UPI0015E29991|nr:MULTISPECIES: site-specific integrase [Xanthomonas]MBB5735900.1 integrase [Xanthomonas sp. CFBP 8152]